MKSVDSIIASVAKLKEEVQSLKKIVSSNTYPPNLTKEELIEVLNNNELKAQLQRMNTLLWVGLVVGILALASLWFMAEY